MALWWELAFMWANLILLAGTVVMQNVVVMSFHHHHHHQTALEWMFYPSCLEAINGASWEALLYLNAEPSTMVQQVANQHVLKGFVQAKVCSVAMS